MVNVNHWQRGKGLQAPERQLGAAYRSPQLTGEACQCPGCAVWALSTVHVPNGGGPLSRHVLLSNLKLILESFPAVYTSVSHILLACCCVSFSLNA
jgi:hypothetical protein